MSDVAEKPTSGLKKKLLIINLLLDVFVILPVALFFLLVPRNEIASLQKGYVKTTIGKDKRPSYKIVKKRPKSWATLKEMNYVAVHAIVVSEDWFFYGHNGYDLGQIKEAVVDSVEEGKKLRGASTISQQLVKNLFFENDRSFIRKFKEVVFTIYLERKVTKEKILETYLNIIQYGDGIYGIKAAARHYFNKTPRELTPREGAFLAMLLPNPVRYAQSFKDKGLTEYASKTVNTILEKMVRAKYIKKEQLEKYQSQKFRWEKGLSTSHTKGLKSAKRKGKSIKARRGSGASGKNYEARYKSDQDLELDDNPEFDEDAIIEDTSGIEEEFNVE